jgi:hypothetical protein
VTRLRAGRCRNCGSILGLGKRLNSFLSRLDRLWGPQSPYSKRTRGSYPGCREAGSWCWSLIPPRDNVKNEWSYTSSPHVPSWCLQTQLYLHTIRHCQMCVGFPTKIATHLCSTVWNRILSVRKKFQNTFILLMDSNSKDICSQRAVKMNAVSYIDWCNKCFQAQYRT